MLYIMFLNFWRYLVKVHAEAEQGPAHPNPLYVFFEGGGVFVNFEGCRRKLNLIWLTWFLHRKKQSKHWLLNNHYVLGTFWTQNHRLWWFTIPWCQGTVVASLWGVLSRRFQLGIPAISGPMSCSIRLRSLSLLHSFLKDYKWNHFC